jgi:hypothetical protein
MEFALRIRDERGEISTLAKLFREQTSLSHGIPSFVKRTEHATEKD